MDQKVRKFPEPDITGKLWNWINKHMEHFPLIGDQVNLHVRHDSVTDS